MRKKDHGGNQTKENIMNWVEKSWGNLSMLLN